jgi:ubiquinol-cytochrome c reductase cytochrome c1 subunit
VFREVCANCHSLNYVPFRALASHSGPGFTPEQVAAIAAEYQVNDGPNDAGEMFERPGKPSDHMPAPFPNAQAAAVANGGAVPPDLSLMAKARSVGGLLPWSVLDLFKQYQEGGADYMHALLTGYGQTPPAGVEIPQGTHYNPYFNAAVSLAMPPPLQADAVAYTDGTPTTVDQYSRDVSAFLMWAAEPNLVDRKRIGFQVAIFLLAFGVLMYLSKKRVWARAH